MELSFLGKHEVRNQCLEMISMFIIWLYADWKSVKHVSNFICLLLILVYRNTTWDKKSFDVARVHRSKNFSTPFVRIASSEESGNRGERK